VATSIAIVAIFLPVAFMSGIIGKFFFQFGITLSGAVLISLLEAVTLTPMRCSQFVHISRLDKGVQPLGTGAHAPVDRFYGRFLGWCLGYRTDRLMAEARGRVNYPWIKALLSKFFFTNPKALMADAQEEIKNPSYSLAPILWFLLLDWVFSFLGKIWKPIGV
jgi:multidrug efflux pump subunit AcrB